jgi:hypothetical protein
MNESIVKKLNAKKKIVQTGLKPYSHSQSSKTFPTSNSIKIHMQALTEMGTSKPFVIF